MIFRTLCSSLLACSTLSSAAAVKETLCEYARNPIGVDSPSPRLSWVIESGRRGELQSAYQIQISTSVERLKAGEADLWDTGKVASSQSIQVRYSGKSLVSRQRCYWRVRVWDADGKESPFSEPAYWEMGLLAQDDWKAQWIGFSPGWAGHALYFRRDFELTKPVLQARAYVAGLGYYELRMNGAKVGDHVLDPGTTDYSKRVLYATYDAGGHLRPGRNTIGVIVGNGWYGMPKLLLQLEVQHPDGSTTVIETRGMISDPKERWSVSRGPIVKNSIYDGEVYDARLEQPGWETPDESRANPTERTARWLGAHPIEPPGGRLVSQMMEPIKVVSSLRPIAMKEPLPGVFVFDTGQNLSGWAKLRVRGPSGTRVTLKFAENLSPDGTVNQENLRVAAATDVYILRGGKEEEWEPRFTYHGFRYVQVEGFPGRPAPESLTVRVVRSAVESNGDFESSNPLINRIQKMVWWTEASNLHSIPTDCPQRDERMGWMNDMTVRIEQALYNFRLARFYNKFIDDVRDTQDTNGAIADTVPFKWGKRPADPVSASYLLLAWSLYEHYGDTSAMARHFDGLRAWVDYLVSRSDDLIVNYGSWGDWAPPAKFSVSGSVGGGAISAQTPLPFMSTGYLFYSARLLSGMAKVLGKTEERSKYERLAAETAEAFNRKFWNEAAGGYANNNQAANSFALFLGVVPESRRGRVLANLVKDVEAHDGHLTTGNLCTKYLLEVLTENGHADLAFRIATQESYPSWGFMLANGATTVWERWEHLTGGSMNSHNHPMMGSASSWFAKYLGGIRVDPADPGFKRIVIQPHMVKGLEWVRSEYKSLYGVIRSEWRRDGTKVTLRVTVPPNTTATVHLPSGPGPILEGGVALEKASGVRLIRREAGVAILEAGSGVFEFNSTL